MDAAGDGIGASCQPRRQGQDSEEVVIQGVYSCDVRLSFSSDAGDVVRGPRRGSCRQRGPYKALQGVGQFRYRKQYSRVNFKGGLMVKSVSAWTALAFAFATAALLVSPGSADEAGF